ncbi:hypothetical protein MSBRW_0450 [Methanosarcina barkeri str. Wiesmoor]|uniref:Uncharacterized protein n=2 Tax=Methanosarcina barkeri TaxID=2208 RepID=A0A0E3QIL9_METBA|nr:hypothetical protein [Methanosarcina barkeri]AKB49703.1 hypothetical protein MSBRW_0450 [Methanosarcina barkeri str. Wiesmoor]
MYDNMSQSEENIKSEINSCNTCSADPKNWRICVKTWMGWLKNRILGVKNWVSEICLISWKLILILILSGLIMLIAKEICGFLFWDDRLALFNSTLFVTDDVDTKATLLGMSANVILTSSLIVVTAFYALDTHAMLKQSKDKQRIEYIEKSLENFYLPVKDILQDKQYFLPELCPARSNLHYDGNYKKYLLLFDPPDPYTKENPQAILYHVQSAELKKFGIYTYRVNKSTFDLFYKVTTMEAYNKHLQDCKENSNAKLLLKYTKTDFDELLCLVNKDIEDYQEELDRLTRNSSK